MKGDSGRFGVAMGSLAEGVGGGGGAASEIDAASVLFPVAEARGLRAVAAADLHSRWRGGGAGPGRSGRGRSRNRAFPYHLRPGFHVRNVKSRTHAVQGESTHRAIAGAVGLRRARG